MKSLRSTCSGSATRAVIENRTFERFRDRDSGATYERLEFRKCHFENCLLSTTQRPELRSTIRDVKLLSCTASGNCGVGPAILDNVVVDNLRIVGRAPFVWGAVCRHVVLRGRIDEFVWNAKPSSSSLEVENAFRAANDEFYETVDWALDIADAEFRGTTMRGVPARLIRRDPETQGVVMRERALQTDWRTLPLRRTLFQTIIATMVKFGRTDAVLIAGKRSRHFDDLVHDLKVLRDAGVAEPD